MAVPHLHLHSSSRKSDSTNNTATDANGSNSNISNPENGRHSGDSGCGNSNSPLTSPTSVKRSSRFRIGSLKQLSTATRNEIKSNVRNDWEWPLPQDRDPKDFTSSRLQPDTPFVEREPGSELSEDIDEDDDFGYSIYNKRVSASGGLATQLLRGGFSEKKLLASSGMARGHSRQASKASASSTAGLDSTEARKERRRRRLREELEWNEGLQVFEARRNAWTGSVLRKPDFAVAKANSKTTSLAASPTTTNDLLDSTDVNEDDSNSKASNADEETSTSDSATTAASPISDLNGHSSTDGSLLAQPEPTKDSSPAAVASSEHADLVPFVPVPAPIITPEHPVRREINPATYPQIYNRVVVQGTAPNVPINLADMTSILVAGWKMDDQWPPRPSGPLEPLAGRRKKKGGSNGPDGAAGGLDGGKNGTTGGGGGGLVSGLKKVLRITSGGSKGGNATMANGEKLPTKATTLLDA